MQQKLSHILSSLDDTPEPPMQGLVLNPQPVAGNAADAYQLQQPIQPGHALKMLQSQQQALVGGPW